MQLVTVTDKNIEELATALNDEKKSVEVEISLYHQKKLHADRGSAYIIDIPTYRRRLAWRRELGHNHDSAGLYAGCPACGTL